MNQAFLHSLFYNFIRGDKMFAERLKEVRIERGLRQNEVADGINITSRAICYYEAGTREPSLDLLTKLCKFLDVPADYLLGLTDSY